MIRQLASSALAALLASAMFSGPAFAEGDYYEGISKNKQIRSVDSVRTNSTTTYGYPSRQGRMIFGDTSRDNRHIGDSVDSGDYYQGANRPN